MYIMIFKLSLVLYQYIDRKIFADLNYLSLLTCYG